MRQISGTLGPVIALLVASSISGAIGQFLPQSHLGRLVQSIAGSSPLVLGAQSAAAQYASNYDSDSPSGGYSEEPSQTSNYGNPQPYGQNGPLADTDAPSNENIPQNRGQPLQQEPSQQRGVPQRYYPSSSSYNAANQDDGEGYEPRRAPSGSHSRPTQEYQMGAYLGPSMDDKELNGVFNSNDDRDDVDNGGYDDGGRVPSYRKNAASSNQYPREENEAGPQADGYSRPSYGPSNAAPYRGYNGPSSYDEESADEDERQPLRSNDGFDGANMRRGRGGEVSRGQSGPLNQAASQYLNQKQRDHRQPKQSQSSHRPEQSQLQAAANGYVPYGYANGPVDLTSILSGMNPNYQNDAYAGYPGQNYYRQQGNPTNNRKQAASTNNGYNYGQNGYQSGFGPAINTNQQQSERANRDDDMDSDIDEDRA